tara:strand:- start:3552 stop:3863 length:312 start_codon:yes stop_codon:yes gene_type:complete
MKFLELLSNVKHATQNQKRNELWDVEGILHNQTFKFDLRPLKNNAKQGSFITKADKIVYDIKDEYIVVDVEELHKYIKEDNKKVVYLNDLLSNLEWNIVLQKQ